MDFYIRSTTTNISKMIFLDTQLDFDVSKKFLLIYIKNSVPLKANSYLFSGQFVSSSKLHERDIVRKKDVEKIWDQLNWELVSKILVVTT